MAQTIPEHSERKGRPEEVARRQRALAVLEQYWAAPSVDLTSRTLSVDSRARELHSQGRFTDAGRLMDTWSLAHPEAPYHIRFCFGRFSIAHFGEGNEAVARRMLGIMDELLARRDISPETWEVKAMTEAYYNSLLLTGPRRMQQLTEFYKETRQMSEPTTTR